MNRVFFALALFALALPASVMAQSTVRPTAVTVTACGTAPNSSYATVGGQQMIVMDVNGNLCMSGGGTGGAFLVTPAQRTIVTLTVKTVTTGGTAVTALTAGQKTAGGWIQNPPSATINLCINEIGTATGTTSSGDTTCLIPGQTYALTPSAGAVSVISSDSSHPFSGFGLN